ncbi:radical SAM/SPASM domain Clo7bot peptide maturase [Bacteroidia bacterium]|nr:radical SAM/SPASM domain Clo7bot peptide maturase [Bacteroidia bacterium]
MNDIISNYVYQFVSSKNDYLVYCSQTNAFLKLTPELYEFFLQCKNNSNLLSELDEDVLNLLKNHKIVVDINANNDYLLKREFCEDQAAYSTAGLGLVLVPTAACNFDCHYCFETNKGGGKMNDKTINNLFDFIKTHEDARELSITWYGGEPLLGFDTIKKILPRLKSEIKIPLKRHSMVTNGYYFSDEIIDFFKEYPLNHIQITLDGNKERHDSIRKQKITGEGSFERIMSNIDKILIGLPETFLAIRVNIEKSNKQDFYDLHQLLTSKYAGKNIDVHPGILRIDNETCTALACTAIGRDEVNEFDFEISKKQKLDDDLYPALVLNSCCTATCTNSYIIGSKGEIYKCWNDVGDEKRAIGNIANKELSNPNLMYRYIVATKWYHNEECKKCFYLPVCSSQCAYYRLRNQYEGGQYNLCQCMQKTPEMLEKCLENFYYNQFCK